MSDIQRKLEMVDKQLSGGFINSCKRITAVCPLLFAAVGLITGTIIQDRFGLPILIWMAALVICAASTAFILVVRKFASSRIILLSFCIFVGFSCLGAIRLSSFKHLRSNDISNFVGEQHTLVTIRGLIITRPYINRNNNWEFVKFKHRDPSSSFYLKIDEVETIDGWAKVTGTVRLEIMEPVQDLREGDYIQAYCWLDRFKAATDPGQFDLAKYLARKNIFIGASIKSREGIELLESRGKGLFTRIRAKFREIVTEALLGDCSIDEGNKGLLEALLLGYRGNIDSSVYRAFDKTGLLHLISLSGLHLGILVGIIWWLCKAAGLLKRARAVICIIAIAVFLMVVPPRAPTLRAAIIVFVFCVSFFFRRTPNSVNSLSIAAIILLMMKPMQLFDAGWQLSFVTVLAIVLFCQRILFFLYEVITERQWFAHPIKTKPFFRIVSKTGPYILELFSTSIAAWLGSAGILLYHFYTINPLTIVWTVLVLPLVAGILTVGFLKIVLSFLLPSAAAVLGTIVNFLSDLLIWMVKLFSHVDFSQILIGHVPAAVIIFYYGLILFVFFIHFRRPIIKKAICAAMILILLAFLGVTKWQRTYRNSLIMTCLDVGHGQAILVQLPGSANVLFDAGSMYKDDIGRRIVLPFLDYSGINKIDSIIISHDDLDHINGVPEIAGYCKVGGVYSTDAFFIKTGEGDTAKFLKESLRKKGIEIKSMRDFNSDTAADIQVLWPSEQICRNEQLSDNDKSIVCLIEFAGKKILLCSDIEKFAQEELLRLNPHLKADFLVVPHHGSSRTLRAYFLEKLDTDMMICSCSHSDCEKSRVIKSKGDAECLYTGEHGAVVICVAEDGMISLKKFRNSRE